MKKLIAILLLSVAVQNSIAQVWHENKFPSQEAATFDNNGNDLRGFINKYKTDFQAKGDVVNDASHNSWGYFAIKNVKVPGTDKKGNLNYYESFDVTLGMYKTRDGGKATWWGRQHNSPKGAMVYFKAGDPSMLAMDNVKYADVINELNTKKFTIVEYADTMYSRNDFDLLLKNCIFLKNGTIKEVSQYKTMVDFYNGFLDKFTAVNDAVVDDKSFITFFKAGNNKYAGYFNIVNGKLSGKVELIDAPFERDRIAFVDGLFKNLTGSTIYVYGDDAFEMDRIIRKRAEKANLKLEMRKTTATRKFNQDI
jgi:hypothetical protein